MVLLEGTNLSEGRGTTRPFEYVGAPYVTARVFAERLNALGLPGVHFRAAHFQPTFQKWAGSMCGGVQLHVLDRERFEPYLTGIMVISTARSLYPGQFEWRQPPYEYEYEKRPIDLLCGGPRIPEMIESGADSQAIRASWRDEVAAFSGRRQRYLLYE
jgi:uncharacterized protein YbbC (DUF1343 family)